MKKYRHKNTGIVGELYDDGHLHFKRSDSEFECSETLWIGFVKNSKDWQLIKQAPKIGTKVEIKGTVNGCYVMEGKVGIVTNEASQNGLLTTTNYVGDLEAFNIRVNDSWIGRVACTDWQEVVELDYEILSFRVTNKLFIAGMVDSAGNKTGKFGTYKDLECCLENYSIHSIKRLSDNEVFSVRDLVIRQGNNVSIETIQLDKNWMGGVVINRDTSHLGGECLETLRRAKKPLFVTEDQVEIFEGDDFWAINLEKDKPPTVHKLDYQCNYNVAKANGILWFSTEESVQAYIDENKPKYSENDMYSFGQELNEGIKPTYESYNELIKDIDEKV